MARSQIVKVYVSSNEKSKIEARAKALGITISTYLRLLGMNANFIKSDLTYKKISKMGISKKEYKEIIRRFG